MHWLKLKYKYESQNVGMEMKHYTKVRFLICIQILLHRGSNRFSYLCVLAHIKDLNYAK